MDKYRSLKDEYDKLARRCRPFLKGNPDELEFYAEGVLLKIWAGNGRYSEDYAKAIRAISGKDRSPEEILRAMTAAMDRRGENLIPEFFDRMVEKDFASGGDVTKRFVDGFRSFLVGGACINGDFTVEESVVVTEEVRKLMNHALSKGVKVDYGIGRVRKKTTPLNEESYRREAGGPDPCDMAGYFDLFNWAGLVDLAKGGTAADQGGGASAAPGGTGGAEGSAPGSAGGPGAEQPEQQEQKLAAENLAKTDPRTMEELMEELDGLVGLDSIKKDIHSLMNFITITKLRQERGLEVPTISYHLVFTGNPGTGKTTVARLVAGLYHRIGILPKGQLVEVDRGQLVAGYTGQTAIKTGEVIAQALGGVLFIDEAYALVNDEQDSFGKEAVETILKAMEDHWDELVVIVAGYTELMHKFIESNPGFKSRFSKFFEFPDYTGEELLEIFRRFCEGSGYCLSGEAEERMKKELQEMYERRSRHFGNGRTVRNIFEKAIHAQADRLAKAEDKVSDEQLQELTEEDVAQALEAEKGKFTEINM